MVGSKAIFPQRERLLIENFAVTVAVANGVGWRVERPGDVIQTIGNHQIIGRNSLSLT